MREKLLEVLAEPGTGAALTLRNAVGRDGRIDEGELFSSATGRAYPIVRGIPRFVPSEQYAGSFGMQWNAFRDVQVDSSTRGTHSRWRFDEETGWTETDLRGRWLLDAGCGAGRFAEVAAARGAELVALDLSSAVEAAGKTLERFPNVDVVQGSVLEPPLKPRSFDFAYCIGVVQHTPDPNGAVRSVANCVKPDGQFAFTIYARKPWTKLNAKYLVRPLTRRLPKQLLLKAIETSMPVLFPVTDRLYRVPLLGRVARFTIPVANYPERTEYTHAQRYREAVLDTFDMLSPRYDSPMTWREMETVLRNVGAKSWSFKTRVPINCVGVR